MDCCICSDSSEYKETSTLPCGHTFHSTCLATWLWNNPSCPICRLTNTDASDDESDSVTSDTENETVARIQNYVQKRKERKAIISKQLRMAKTKTGMKNLKLIALTKRFYAYKEKHRALRLSLQECDAHLKSEKRLLETKIRTIKFACKNQIQQERILSRQKTSEVRTEHSRLMRKMRDTALATERVCDGLVSHSALSKRP